MKIRQQLNLFLVLTTVILLASCSGIRFLSTPAERLPQPDPTGTATQAPVLPTESPSPTREAVTTLILWVPPQFDPGDDSEAGSIFLNQLDDFRAAFPRMEVEVRVKSLEGPGGMLENLQTAGAAAPQVVPDLVLLPRDLLETAAAEELIYPLEESEVFFTQEDFYPYAFGLSQVGGIPYSVPAAGDVMALAYKTDVTEGPLADWAAVLDTEKALAFPAADPRALVTLALYESDGGELARVDDSYALDRVPMMNVLNFYSQAQDAAVMPYWLAQFETEQQSWEAYRQRQATLALTWTSIYLQNGSLNTSLAPFPTRDGVPYTYGRGWAWAFTRSDIPRREAALTLLDYLTAPEFLGEWTAAAGYVPVSPDSISAWEGEIPPDYLETVLPSARLIPSRQVLNTLGPSIREAVLSVIKDQMSPETVMEVLELKLRDGS
jgi:ABC-type glycerol-3-phosphate transport system substrate-binding protein